MLRKKSIQFSGDFGSISDFGSLHQIDEEDPFADDSSEPKAAIQQKEVHSDIHQHVEKKPAKSVKIIEEPFDDDNYASPLNQLKALKSGDKVKTKIFQKF